MEEEEAAQTNGGVTGGWESLKVTQSQNAAPFCVVKFPLKLKKDFSSLSSRQELTCPRFAQGGIKAREAAGRCKGNAFVKETSELKCTGVFPRLAQPLRICLGVPFTPGEMSGRFRPKGSPLGFKAAKSNTSGIQKLSSSKKQDTPSACMSQQTALGGFTALALPGM